MANLFTSAQSSFLVLRRDLEDVLDEMELPWRVRREMDRLFAESTSPMSLWRNVEFLLEDFAAPVVVRRRIESVFARFLSGRSVDTFNTFNGMNQGSHFTPSYNGFTHSQNPFTNTHFTQSYGSQFGQNPYLTQSPYFTQNPYFTQGFGSQFGLNSQLGQNPYFMNSMFNQNQNPYLTQGFGSQFGQSPFMNSMINQNPLLTQGFGSQFGQSPFTNSMFTQNQNPYFTGREHSAWFTSPRNEWPNTSRFNDGFVPARNWTRGNTFGQFNNGFGGNAWGPTNTNLFGGGNSFGNSFGNSLGNTFGGGVGGNAWGPTNSMFGSNTNGQHGAFGGNIHSQFGNVGGNIHGQFGNAFGGNIHGQFGNAIGGNIHGQFGNTAFGSQFRGEDFVPPVELIERDGEFVVRVELAGVREQDVEIRANEHVLTIRGERRERFDNEVARHVGAYEYSERRYGTFTRTVTLPLGIDAAHIHAVFRDGVLELRIPQAETYRARRIPIGRIDEQRVTNDLQGVHVRPHVS
jgi:HSP20 family protein